MSVEPTADCLAPGFVLGNYCIERVLGRGGFGITYLATDLNTQCRVVIKESMPIGCSYRDPNTGRVYPTGGGEGTQFFEMAMMNSRSEGEHLQKFRHPNIVPASRVFKALGTVYYVMPFIGGYSLNDVAKKGPLTEAELLPILVQILHALRYIHANRLFHRDIKPQNIMLTAAGKPVLIDFGTARYQSHHTQVISYSDGYTPIEQMQNDGQIGPWSDLYALGATMLYLMTLQPIPSSLERESAGDPIPVLRTHPDFSKCYSAAFLGGIDKALQRRHQDRWQSADEWLRSFGCPPETAVQTPPAQPHRRFSPPGPSVPESPLRRPAVVAYVAAMMLLYGISYSGDSPAALGFVATLAYCGMNYFGAIWITMQNRSRRNCQSAAVVAALLSVLTFALLLAIVCFVEASPNAVGALCILWLACFVIILSRFLWQKMGYSYLRIIAAFGIIVLSNVALGILFSL